MTVNSGNLKTFVTEQHTLIVRGILGMGGMVDQGFATPQDGPNPIWKAGALACCLCVCTGFPGVLHRTNVSKACRFLKAKIIFLSSWWWITVKLKGLWILTVNNLRHVSLFDKSLVLGSEPKLNLTVHQARSRRPKYPTYMLRLLPFAQLLG